MDSKNNRFVCCSMVIKDVASSSSSSQCSFAIVVFFKFIYIYAIIVLCGDMVLNLSIYRLMNWCYCILFTVQCVYVCIMHCIALMMMMMMMMLSSNVVFYHFTMSKSHTNLWEVEEMLSMHVSSCCSYLYVYAFIRVDNWYKISIYAYVFFKIRRYLSKFDFHIRQRASKHVRLKHLSPQEGATRAFLKNRL